MSEDTAIAGIVFAGRLNAATPKAGVNFELDAIAACYIGGASASGGIVTAFALKCQGQNDSFWQQNVTR